ncbi:MAG: DPP IV N-terminal domain-containing protein [candidate division FCPU426 bacterium]
MKSWFVSSFIDDEGTFLKSVTLLALIILILIFVFGYHPTPVTIAASVEALAAGEPVLAAAVAPLPRILSQPKTLYLAERPTFPPLVQTTPVPTPTPAGGGILRKIAFASNRSDGRHYQLYLMDADGNHCERLMESNAFDRDPHLSYDGHCLAFSSNRTSTYQIYVMDLATRAIRQVTHGVGDKTNPFWSPDGRSLLYTTHRDGSAETGIISADGSQMRQLTHWFGHTHGYGFSPDGAYVSLESSRNNRSEIFMMKLQDQKPIPLIETDELTYMGDPVFSPVGNKMVFSSNSLDRMTRQLYIYDLNWQKYYRITDDEMDKDDPIFSPDGTLIAYVARWENAWNIFIMDADGQHVRNLTRSYYDNLVPSWR